MEFKFHLFYSEFLPTILKSLKFLCKKTYEDVKQDYYYKSILKLLKLFIQDDVQNSKLIVTEALFTFIEEIPIDYSTDVFEILLLAVTNIAKANLEFHYTKSILKRVYMYTFKLWV